MKASYIVSLIPLLSSSFIYGLPCQEGGLTEKVNCLNRKLETLMQINSTLNNKINDAAKVPAGTVVAFAGDINKIPEGWVLCDGKVISRKDKYSELFNTIGTAHGQGDGSTTFHLPDYRGLFLRGVLNDRSGLMDPSATTRGSMNTGGNTGNKVGSYQGDSFGEHSHNSGNLRNSSSYLSYNGSGTPDSRYVSGTTQPDGDHSHNHPTHYTRQHLHPGNGFAVIQADPSISQYNKSTQSAGSHSHSFSIRLPNYSFSINTSIPAQTISGTTANQGGSETRPKNAYVNYIIKY